MDRLRIAHSSFTGLALALILAGCASNARLSATPRPDPNMPVAAPAPAPEPVASPPPLPAPVVPQAERAEFKPLLYKLWYATNRVPVQSKGEVVDYSPKWDRQGTHYGKLYAEIPEDYLKEVNNPGWLGRFFPTSEAKLRLTKPNELDSQAFLDQLRNDMKGVGPGERQILIYLHGFNTTFKEAAQRAASIGYQLKMPTTAFFSWPSQGGMRKYIADKDLADLSLDDIADFILKAHSESGATRVHLIAHSMGNYALLGAMHRPKMQQAIKDGLRFGQVILAAPDVETEKFKRDVRVFSGISERVSLYVSDGDIALKTSKKLAAGLARAGLRPPVLVLKDIDTVDVSSTNLTLLGHAYVSQEIAVLNDMHSLILHNAPPESRIRLTRKDEYWELQ